MAVTWQLRGGGVLLRRVQQGRSVARRRCHLGDWQSCLLPAAACFRLHSRRHPDSLTFCQEVGTPRQQEGAARGQAIRDVCHVMRCNSSCATSRLCQRPVRGPAWCSPSKSGGAGEGALPRTGGESALRSQGRLGAPDAMSANNAATPGSRTDVAACLMAGPKRRHSPVLGLRVQQYCPRKLSLPVTRRHQTVQHTIAVLSCTSI